MTGSDPVREMLINRLKTETSGWPDDLADPRRPAFFSRQQPAGDVSWYAVAHSPRQARELREYLLAFIGPSRSDFIGETSGWAPADPFEAELAVTFPNGLRVIARAADADAVAKLFARLRQMLRERPSRERAKPLPLGRLLRDFELFVRDGDWQAGSAVLDHLRERGQLTIDQLAGLHLRLLAGQERWGEVLAAPELPSLVAQRLPTSVTEAVAVAVYHEHLAKFSTQTEAATYFREHVAAAYGLIFRQRAKWRNPDAVKAAAIADASLETAAIEAPQLPTDLYTRAVRAQNANDAAAALQLLLPGPFTSESLRLLVEAALDLGTREAARVAVAAIRNADPPLREKAFERRTSKALLEELEEVAGENEAATPSDWIGWLTRAADGSLPEAVEVASRGVVAWPRPDPGPFNAALSQHIGEAFSTVRDALPSLLDLLLPNGEVDARFAPAYRLLLEQLVLDDDLSPATAPAVAEFAAAVLRSNPVASKARNDYTEVIEYLAVAWGHLKRPALLDWGLGLLDTAAEHAVHRHTDVTRFVQDVVSEFARVPRLVTSGQRALLRAICFELDVPAAAELVTVPSEPGAPTPEDEAAVLQKKLGKRSVILLTLQDRIAAIFRQLMRESYPDARVDVVQEYAGTKRLRDVAENADVFIVNTFDAKHAATSFIPQHRPSGAPTLYPKGKNAARQVDALEDWLRSLS